MDRKLNTYPIPHVICSKLSNRGFVSAEDLIDVRPSQLIKEAGLTENEALDVLEMVFPRVDEETAGHCTLGVSALDILIQENERPPIPTFCEALDDILGGGIPLMKLTELCGAPGVGKTQMCLQFCTNVQIPEACGGLEGEAVFIDTEGSFVVDRLLQIATSTVDSCQKIMQASGSNVSIESFKAKKILEGVFYFRCNDFSELIACINVMDEFLKEHPKISLIVIDSISFHFRYGFEDKYTTRSKVLFGLSQSLIKLANKFKLAVVLTNQMTHKMDSENKSIMVPAMGESWGHACAIRLILKLNEAKREAFLCKSPWKKEATVAYRISPAGIRDHHVPPAPDTSFQPNKRAKT